MGIRRPLFKGSSLFGDKGCQEVLLIGVLIIVTKCDKEQLKGGRTDSGSQFEGIQSLMVGKASLWQLKYAAGTVHFFTLW